MVIIFFDAKGVARDGQPYRNTYTWYFQMRDGVVFKAVAFFDVANSTTSEPRVARKLSWRAASRALPSRALGIGNDIGAGSLKGSQSVGTISRLDRRRIDKERGRRPDLPGSVFLRLRGNRGDGRATPDGVLPLQFLPSVVGVSGYGNGSVAVGVGQGGPGRGEYWRVQPTR
jgi:hypothetical protein